VPSRYIEFVDRDSTLDYNTVLENAGQTVKELLKLQEENRRSLVNAFKAIGYDAE
jgi:type I restriction enzyme M protein